MSWLSLLVVLYCLGFTTVMLFLAGAAQLNERADRWAEEMSDYFAWREYDSRRAA